MNYKGGVGKTTLTANVSAELARRGFKVLMIDLDAQASLTFSFLKPEDWRKKYSDEKTIKSWFKPARKAPVSALEELIINLMPELPGKLDLIASHLDLINVDLELATQLGGANMQQSKQNFLKVHARLLNGIKQLPRGLYDFAFIDCPPNFNIVTKNAIVASDRILIPAKPDYLSTLGIDYLQKSVNGLVKEYNDYCDIEDDEEAAKIHPEITGVIFTMVQYYAGQLITANRLSIEETQKSGIRVFDQYLRENKTMFSDAPRTGIPVVLNHKNRDGIIKEIMDLVSEIELKFAV
jgi:chromosome partitioning protein